MSETATRASSMYREMLIPKPDGTKRRVFFVKEPLRGIQTRIKRNLLARVTYPKYLKGGLAGRDYIQNAEEHLRPTLLVTEDIANFFPSITNGQVTGIWRGVFRFSNKVAELLTRLTTLEGVVPQGAKTSTHLANLALWKFESRTVQRLKVRGLRYTRYIDDISVSAKRRTPKRVKTFVVGEIASLIAGAGFSLKRPKHRLITKGRQQLVNRLKINSKVALTDRERSSIRAAVHKARRALRNPQAIAGDEMAAQMRSLFGRLARLRRFHPREAGNLEATLLGIPSSPSAQ